MELGVLGGAGAFLVVLFVALCILWFFLPFAVFGVKPLLTKLISEQKAGNDLARQLLVEIRALRGGDQAAPVAAAPAVPPPAPVHAEPPEPPPAVPAPAPRAPARPSKGMTAEEREALMVKARQLAAEREARGAGHLDVD